MNAKDAILWLPRTYAQGAKHAAKTIRRSKKVDPAPKAAPPQTAPVHESQPRPQRNYLRNEIDRAKFVSPAEAGSGIETVPEREAVKSYMHGLAIAVGSGSGFMELYSQGMLHLTSDEALSLLVDAALEIIRRDIEYLGLPFEHDPEQDALDEEREAEIEAKIALAQLEKLMRGMDEEEHLERERTKLMEEARYWVNPRDIPMWVNMMEVARFKEGTHEERLNISDVTK